VLTGSLARLVLGLALGSVLGIVGLPRLDLSAALPPFFHSLQGAARPVASEVRDQNATTPEPVPTVEPSPVVPVPQPAVAGPQVLLDEHFAAAPDGWPDDPQGPAWFADGAYRLYARQPNRFVAVGVPLPTPVGDAILSAQFRKLGGPAGGGYGLIVRDMTPASDRDGRSQDGQYLVAGVGDRGDIGVWQRDRTHWIDVVPWTHSDVVHQELDSNVLVVTTRGAAVRLEVNGQVVADVTYDGLPSTGNVGIFVGGDLNQVALEWLRIDG